MSLIDYWDQQHTNHLQINKIKMLTGTSLSRYFELFKLNESDIKNKTVLEIGVGTGDATKAMSKIVKDLDALDISPVAIDKVSKCISNGYLSAIDLNSDKYDAVISNLVAQHMSTEDLKIQLKDVIRSLKDDGVFYLQFSEAKGTNPETIEVQQGGGVLHSVEDMEKIVASCGGNMQLIQTIQILPIVQWHCVAIRRK